MRIPTGWERCKISDVLAAQDNGKLLRQGWSPKCEKHPALTDSDWGVLKTTSIQSGSFLAEYNKALPDSLHPRPGLEVAICDLLLTCAGPRSRCGVPCLVRSTRPRLMISGKMYKMRASPQVLPAFAEAWLLTSEAQKAVDRMKTGGSDSGLNLTQGRFLRLPFLLAPLPEQRRIIAKIEPLFARLDEGIAALKRVQANLDRYWASVLKAAVEGRLTEQWREENPPEETGEELLDRMLAERRKRWEEEALAKFAAKGRKPPKDWKEKYQAPVKPDTSKLPKLPNGWCWSTVDQLAEVTGGLTKSPARSGLPVRYPYLRVANVYADELRLDEVSTIGVSESEFDRVVLRPGDLLVVEGNGSAKQIGRVAQWQGDLEPCCHQNHLIKVRCARSTSRPRWILLWLLSPGGRQAVLKKASSTSGLYTLSLSKVRAFPVPLAPIREQVRAIGLADSLRDTARIVRDQVQAEMAIRASALRQSILKRAFEGRLVPQDANDEPASVLLEHMRAEREAERRKRRRRTAKPKRKSQVS